MASTTESSSPSNQRDLFNLLDADNIETVEETKALILENLHSSRDPGLLNSMVEYYFKTRSATCLQILTGILLWSSIPAKNQLWHTTSNFNIQSRTLELNIQLKHWTSHFVISIFSSRYWNQLKSTMSNIDVHSFSCLKYEHFNAMSKPDNEYSSLFRFLKINTVIKWLKSFHFTLWWDVDIAMKCCLRCKMLTSFCERRAIPAKKYQMSQGCVTS